MSLLEDLNACLLPIGDSHRNRHFQRYPAGRISGDYTLWGQLGLHADNTPLYDIQEARLSYFNKGNYTKQKTR